MEKNKIFESLERHKQKVFSLYPEDQILGIFLYGSQNYGLDTENSDVDTKCIYIPSIDELCLNSPTSKEFNLENNEKCLIKDIREIVINFKKQNINFIEILFTEYFWVNPKYQKIWEKYFIFNREKIAIMDKRRVISSMCGQILHTLDTTFSGDGKKFSRSLALFEILKRILNNELYENCINFNNHPDKEFVQKIKKYKMNELFFTAEEKNYLENSVRNFREKELQKNCLEPNKEVEQILADGIIALITNENFHFNFYK